MTAELQFGTEKPGVMGERVGGRTLEALLTDGLDWLSGLIAEWVYPAVILGVVLGMLVLAGAVALLSPGLMGRARSWVGAGIPLVVVVLLTAAAQDGPAKELQTTLDGRPRWILILCGFVAGVGLIELGKFLARQDSETAYAIAATLASLVGATLMYILLTDTITSAHWLLMGALVGALDFVLLGFGDSD